MGLFRRLCPDPSTHPGRSRSPPSRSGQSGSAEPSRDAPSRELGTAASCSRPRAVGHGTRSLSATSRPLRVRTAAPGGTNATTEHNYRRSSPEPSRRPRRPATSPAPKHVRGRSPGSASRAACVGLEQCSAARIDCGTAVVACGCSNVHPRPVRDRAKAGQDRGQPSARGRKRARKTRAVRARTDAVQV